MRRCIADHADSKACSKADRLHGGLQVGPRAAQYNEELRGLSDIRFTDTNRVPHVALTDPNPCIPPLREPLVRVQVQLLCIRWLTSVMHPHLDSRSQQPAGSVKQASGPALQFCRPLTLSCPPHSVPWPTLPGHVPPNVFSRAPLPMIPSPLDVSVWTSQCSAAPPPHFPLFTAPVGLRRSASASSQHRSCCPFQILSTLAPHALVRPVSLSSRMLQSRSIPSVEPPPEESTSF